MTRAKCLIPALLVTLGGLFWMTGCANNTDPPQEQSAAPAPDNGGDQPKADAPPPAISLQPAADTPKPAARADAAIAMGTAVDPKPLSDGVKKGLEYLINQQHANGGWGQGGGWRDQLNGSGRIEGADVQDPPDVGNTCLAVLALIRAGNSPKEGPYAKNVAKAVEFICAHIEKSDDKSLYVTDIKGTQLQSKIGVYVDTFLSSMVLAELKGRMQDAPSEKRMVAALTKTVNKMEVNQKTDGTFAGNTGWASILSQGLANKGFARASQNGVAVSPTAIANVQGQITANFDATKGGAVSPTGGGSITLGGLGGASAREASASPVTGATAATVPVPSTTDAGVAIYNGSAVLTNAADVSNTYRQEEKKAKEVLAKKDAPKAEKDKAEQTLQNIEKNEKVRAEATDAIVKQLDQPGFVQGFGSNGGEEFLSFMNISEALLLKGGDDWKKWDKTVTDLVSRVQDKDGSWSGHHCITGKTACTAGALLVLMADRAPIPVAVASDKTQK